MTRLYFVVPEWIDDPARPSGGNTYGRRVAPELRALGWDVVEVHALDDAPADALVLLDALITPPATAHRRLVLLVHMAFRWRELLPQAAAVIMTSAWLRDTLSHRYPLSPELCRVAYPGADPADLATGTPAGTELLCVGAVAEHKGQDVLLDALARLTDLPWQCTLVGPLDREPDYVAALRARPIASRVEFAGPRVGLDLDATYARSDLLLFPSRNDAYGMVVTEALARGLPVIASDVGGVSEALGNGGRLIPADSPAVLARELRRWLTDPGWRAELRARARQRRATLTGWSETARTISDVLTRVAR